MFFKIITLSFVLCLGIFSGCNDQESEMELLKKKYELDRKITKKQLLEQINLTNKLSARIDTYVLLNKILNTNNKRLKMQLKSSPGKVLSINKENKIIAKERDDLILEKAKLLETMAKLLKSAKDELEDKKKIYEKLVATQKILLAIEELSPGIIKRAKELENNKKGSR